MSVLYVDKSATKIHKLGGGGVGGALPLWPSYQGCALDSMGVLSGPKTPCRNFAYTSKWPSDVDLGSLSYFTTCPNFRLLF